MLQASLRRFDKGGDAFYDQISALHKSVRGSSPDASLYWFCRMLDGGCDPLYIARRVVRMASEDIGNADPRALGLCLEAWQVQERLGSPEGELALAQAIVYLACAPKSNAVYNAYKAATADVAAGGSAEVPMHLRNAPTQLMKEMDHGAGYRYAHDEPEGYAAGENYFPRGTERSALLPNRWIAGWKSKFGKNSPTCVNWTKTPAEIAAGGLTRNQSGPTRESNQESNQDIHPCRTSGRAEAAAYSHSDLAMRVYTSRLLGRNDDLVLPAVAIPR